MRQAFAQSSAPSKSKRADEPDEDDSPTKKIRQAEPKNMPKQKAKGRGRGTGRGASNEKVLQSLTKLSINHEDSLNILQQELSWVMYLTTGELSILPNIYAEKSKDASKLSTPFRTRAMRLVLEQTLERVEQIQTKEEVLVDAEKEGWVVRVKDTEAPAFVYQQWSSEQDKRHCSKGSPRRGRRSIAQNVLGACAAPTVDLQAHALTSDRREDDRWPSSSSHPGPTPTSQR